MRLPKGCHQIPRIQIDGCRADGGAPSGPHLVAHLTYGVDVRFGQTLFEGDAHVPIRVHPGRRHRLIHGLPGQDPRKDIEDRVRDSSATPTPQCQPGPAVTGHDGGAHVVEGAFSRPR